MSNDEFDTTYRISPRRRLARRGRNGWRLSCQRAGDALLAALLPVTRVEAVMSATLLAFPVCAIAVMWAFAARSALRVWAGIVSVSAILAGAGVGVEGRGPRGRDAAASGGCRAGLTVLR